MSTQTTLQSAFLSNKSIKLWAVFIGIFASIFFIQFPFIHYYGSFTDQGYHLVNQDLAHQLGLKYIQISPWWWLSDIIASWWMNLYDSFGCWGNKIGALAAIAITGVISANTIFQLHKPNLGIVFAMAVAGFCLPHDTINYYSVPILIYSIFCFFFLKTNSEPSRTLYPILSGITYLLLVFSRLSLVISLFIPIVCLIASFAIEKKQRRLLFKAYLKMFGTIAICLALFSLYLQSQGMLKSYIFIETLPTKFHSITGLWTVLFNQLSNKLAYLMGVAVAAYAFYLLLKNKLLSGRLPALATGAILMFGIVMIGLYIKFPAFKELKKALSKWPDGFDLFPVFVSINFVCIYLLRKTVSFREIVLLLLSLSWPLMRAVSTTGIECGLMISFLLCGMTAVSLIRLGTEYNCRIPLFSLGALLTAILISKGAYEYLPRSKTMDYGLHRLEGIYTTPDRAENMRTLIHEMKRYVKKGDHILALPYIPLVYFASDTLPLGNHVEPFLLSHEDLFLKLDQISMMQSPPVIVKPKIDFENPITQQIKFEWPITEEFTNDLNYCLALFDEKIMKKWKMNLVWSNDYFELFVPSDEASSNGKSLK